jgi:hypothetical protein
MLAIVLILLIILFYFLPTMIAGRSGHPRTSGIFVINLVFGWSVLGWVIALVWALSPPLQAVSYGRLQNDDDRKPQPWRETPRDAEAERRYTEGLAREANRSRYR